MADAVAEMPCEGFSILVEDLLPVLGENEAVMRALQVRLHGWTEGENVCVYVDTMYAYVNVHDLIMCVRIQR